MLHTAEHLPFECDIYSKNPFPLKGTLMQIEKVVTNNRLRV